MKARTRRLATLLTTAAGLIVFGAPLPAQLPSADPAAVGMDGGHLQRIDEVIAAGLAEQQMAGCVVCVGRRGKIVLRKAYGYRQQEPDKVAMTVDTVFDMASITKPVSTATSIMLLVERGMVRLHDRVATHIPEFGQNGKEDIRILDLLLHQGGLIPDNALQDYDQGADEALRRIYQLKPRSKPGSKFVYTDVGFIVLAELVRRRTGQDVHQFTRENVFGPLGMRETGYLPEARLRKRAAVTEQRDGKWMRGEVHDPRAYRLGGIAGHAGLFSTADDLAIYAQMMLDKGSRAGVKILSPRTVATMTRGYPVSSGTRGLGWDKQTGYSSNRGELFSERAFGHGGFTGTVLWMDPALEMFVVFLSNRLHPDGEGSVNAMAGRIGTIAAAAIVARPSSAGQHPTPVPRSNTEVLTGLDVLIRDGFQQLQGRRVGLITNHTGIRRDGVSAVRLLHKAENLELVSLFSPEHGFAGALEQAVIPDSRDQATGLQVHSLYGDTRRPTAEMLEGLDTLVFDIQDIGTRFYTYVSTMGYAMQAAAENQLRFVVLDRPNPINGVDVAGPLLDAGRESFVGFHRLPVRHGMTVGELARMFRTELHMKLDLQIVQLEGWQRSDFFDATGLLWENPSPNMRSLTEALLYPGIGLLETTNLSVGRGTDTPFEVIGAPWLDGRRLASQLNRADLTGVRFVPIRFQPDASKYAGEPCGGVNIIITNRQHFEPLTTGLEIARQLHKLYPMLWQVEKYGRLLASDKTLQALRDGQTTTELLALQDDDLRDFRQRRARFLLYR